MQSAPDDVDLERSNVAGASPGAPSGRCFRAIADAIKTPSRRLFQFTIRGCVAYARFSAADTRAVARARAHATHQRRREKTRGADLLRLPPLYEFDTCCGFLLAFMMGIHVNGLSTFPDCPVREQQVPRLLANSAPLLSAVDTAANA